MYTVGAAVTDGTPALVGNESLYQRQTDRRSLLSAPHCDHSSGIETSIAVIWMIFTAKRQNFGHPELSKHVSSRFNNIYDTTLLYYYLQILFYGTDQALN